MSDLSKDAPNSEPTIDSPAPSSPWTMLITMVLLVAALSLTGVMFLYYAGKNAPEEPSAKLTSIEGEPHPAPAEVVPAAKEPAELEPVAEEPAAEKKGGFSLASIKNLFTSNKATTTNAVTEKPAAKTVEKEPSSGGFKLFGDRPAKVNWPKLKLTGFGTSADGSGGFAIINNTQVHPGQLINDKVKLVEVREHDVIVEYKGEQKSLTVDVRN